MKTRLFRKHANGIGYWEIWQDEINRHLIVLRYASSIDGSYQEKREFVAKGLAGRTLDEQVRSRINSRISRMKDKGYKDTIDAAKASSGNQMGLDRPMLAQTWESTPPGFKVLQKKLDGHRCLVTRQDGKLIAYTRQGKPITTIKHILDRLEEVVVEGQTLDGELYSHGTPLQTIGSWIKRWQPETEKLIYAVYDQMSDLGYDDRYQELSELGLTKFPVILLPIIKYESDAQMQEALSKVRQDGFEGLMMRMCNKGYQPGLRSSQLLKVKVFLDAEFECIDIVPSEDGWGKAILKCEGGTFTASCPGSIDEKHRQMREKDKYIGKMLTVQFPYLTDDKIPFQPTALRWKEDL